MSAAAGHAPETLDDIVARWLPDAQFAETHSMEIDAAPRPIIAAFRGLDTGADGLVRAFLWLRELPSRALGRVGAASSLAGRPPFGMHNFTPLEEHEKLLVLGLAGKFWRLDFGLVPIASPADFSDFNAEGVPRLVMVLAAEPGAQGGSIVCTRTAVYCPDRASRLRFAPYWFAIRATSGLIRRRMLRMIARQVADRPIDADAQETEENPMERRRVL